MAGYEIAHAVPISQFSLAMNAMATLMEVAMPTPIWRKLTSALAAAGLAAALAGPALAQTSAHNHDATAPPGLSLNQGHKWATDEALRKGMTRIRALIAPRLGDAQAGKLTTAQFRDLAKQVGLTNATASYHLTMLLGIGLVGYERIGQKLHYVLYKDLLKDLFDKAYQDLVNQ